MDPDKLAIFHDSTLQFLRISVKPMFDNLSIIVLQINVGSWACFFLDYRKTSGFTSILFLLKHRKNTVVSLVSTTCFSKVNLLELHIEI